MKTKSAKAKGRRLQNFVRDELLKVFHAKPTEIHVAVMGEQGLDVSYKTLGVRKMP